MPDFRQSLTERASEPMRAGLITLQQVKRHALRGFRPNAGQAAQGFDQFFDGGGRFQLAKVSD